MLNIFKPGLFKNSRNEAFKNVSFNHYPLNRATDLWLMMNKAHTKTFISKNVLMEYNFDSTVFHETS